MSFDTYPQERLREQYLAELHGELTIASTRVACLLVGAVTVSFIAIDSYAFPDLFSTFLPVRLALLASLAIAYFGTSRILPRTSQAFVILATGAMLLAFIYGTGGMASPYYGGLMLLFVGTPVVAKFSASEIGAICGSLLSGFLLMPLFMWNEASLTSFTIDSILLVASVATAVVSANLMERARYREFVRRAELEQARDHLEEVDRAKSRFTANVHHELRTPLTLILAPLDGLLSDGRESLSKPLEHTLTVMRTNGRRLLRLINDLLDLAKLESTQFTVHRSPVDPARLVNELVEGARPLADRKEIELSLSQEEPTQGDAAQRILFADADALEKVIVNLLGNALKFTPGGGHIEVTVAAADDGLRISIEDSGIGLEESQLERIFDRFAQVDGSATREFEGTGIGLSLALELVELHGGRLWAESEGVGQGTSMHIFLPWGAPDSEQSEAVLQDSTGRTVALAGALDAIEAELAPEERSAPGDGEHHEWERSVDRWQDHVSEQPQGATTPAPGPEAEVLIAEDNPDMRELLCSVISREFRVRTARNGREALELFREARPHLVLTDLMMPEMSGTELCRAVREEPGAEGVPVVMVTSKAESEMKIEGLEIGADDYVTKPFHPNELLARVRSLVEKRVLQLREIEMKESLEQALADLTETEVQLVQSERMAAVGELAAGVAHEVKNPVNFALNSLRALRSRLEGARQLGSEITAAGGAPQGADSSKEWAEIESAVQEFGELIPEFEEFVEIGINGLERTCRLVNDLQNVAGQGAIQITSLDVRDCIDSTIRLVRLSVEAAGSTLEYEAPEDLPEVRSCGSVLNQVLLNLIKNAVEAMTPQGGGTIRLEASHDGDAVSIVVSDDGPGFSSEIEGREFEPFVSTKAAGEGSGLGLSVCRRSLHEIGSSIDIVDDAEEGTCGTKLEIRLPIGLETGASPDRSG